MSLQDDIKLRYPWMPDALIQIYVDAMKDTAELARGGSLDASNDPVEIGFTGYPVSGVLDEARVQNQGRSEGWVQMSHRSMRGQLLAVD